MITYITGKILKTSFAKDSSVDILTGNGLGYRIFIPSIYNLPSKGENYSLYTHLHIREDSQMLFGFEKEEERDFFEQLISVSGIGPKIGLAILSTYSRTDLESILLNGDAKALSKVSGLGLKGAQKIILELRGKIDLDQKESSSDSIIRELKEALKVLGFSGDLLKEKVASAEEMFDKDKEMEIEELIKKVLNV